MAELATEIKAAEFLVYNAAVAHDDKARFSEEASMAKLKATDVAISREVSSDKRAPQTDYDLKRRF